MESFKPIGVHVTLKGPNYLLWSRNVKTILCGRGLWEHVELGAAPNQVTIVDGNQVVVAGDTTKWFQEDQVVMAIIQSSLDGPIHESYSYCETAKELWDTLKKVFGDISSFTRVFEVQKAINQLIQEDIEFTSHFGKWRSLRAELEMLRPFTTDSEILNKRREEDRVFSLLLTLSPRYNNLIVHILRDDKLPDLDEVCARIQKEKGSLGLFGGLGELVTANKGVFKPSEKKHLFCDHCKKKGHVKDKCWILHPHLKPSKFKDARANTVKEEGEPSQTEPSISGPSPMDVDTGLAHAAHIQDAERRFNLDSLIKSLTHLKESGNAFCISKISKPLVVDSGASHNMVCDSNLIHNIKPAVGNVMIANGQKVPIKGMGDLKLFNKRSKAFYLPKFTSNLLSVHKTTNDLNCKAIFGPNDVKFQDIETGSILGEGVTQGGLYVLEDTKKSSNLSNAFNSIVASSESAIWHARLGHPHSRALKMMLPSSSFDYLDCEACIRGKHCKSVFPTSSKVYENCFELIHSDVWTSPCLSRDNHKYFVTFIDEKSKFTWITLLPSKDRVYDAFINFHNYITNQYHSNVKGLRSDNGGEYTSQRFKEYLAKHGIEHQTSCPYTPQQNGVAERKNRHLMEVARSLMFHTNVPKRFWSDAVMTACYLINRTPTKILVDKSPFEVLNKSKPSFKHLRVFGCVCFVLVPGDMRDKLDEKSTRCMFIGYSTTQKGYKCYNPTTRRVMVSRDVKFIEEKGFHEVKNWDELRDLANTASDRAESLRFILEGLKQSEEPDGKRGSSQGGSANIPRPERAERDPAKQSEPAERDLIVRSGGAERDPAERSDQAERDPSKQNAIRPCGTQSGTAERDPTEQSGEAERDPAERSDQTERDPIKQNAIQPCGTQSGTAERDPTERSDQPGRAPTTNLDLNNDHNHDTSPPPLRRSSRIRKDPSNWVNTRVYYNNQAVAHPNQAVCSLANYPQDHQAFLSKIDRDFIPQTYDEAKDHKVWIDAVGEEAGAMERNQTWYESDLPKGKKAVTSRWIFTIKYKSNGEIERHKVRLVARGFTQTYGEDYRDTFAPVAKLHTVRVILSLATNLDWELWQMDVKNAFLQGELEDEVYMIPPPGLEHLVSPGKVLRLKKAIYGLKQSPRAWYHKLSTTLKGRGFKRSEADHTLFTLQSSNGIVVILVYVDDIIISGNDKEGIKSTKQFLHSVFDIKDLGELKYFLGIEVFRSPDGLFISQRKYTLDLLNEADYGGAKPAKTPLEDAYKATREGEQDNESFEDIQLYRRMVGKLIYLTLTRPDLCFAVNQVSQHMQKPTIKHWNMVVRILKYLKGNPGQGIWMGRNQSTEIVGYCDADWAGDRQDRKSTTGYCTFIGGNLVTWKSKKQKVVSCSSAEAEYRAMRKLTEELTWLKALLKDLGIEQANPMTMHCDNQAAIHIASNSVFHERTKHIEVDCHKVREKVEEGVILPCYTKSSDQLADIFTKAASVKVCEFIHSKLGLINLRPSQP